MIRLYWVGEDANASERFGREAIMAHRARRPFARMLSVIEAGQRGLSSGALTHIHFQTQEALCRHLFNMVEAAVKPIRRSKRHERLPSGFEALEPFVADMGG